jgi:hypothetical protein
MLFGPTSARTTNVIAATASTQKSTSELLPPASKAPTPNAVAISRQNTRDRKSVRLAERPELPMRPNALVKPPPPRKHDLRRVPIRRSA